MKPYSSDSPHEESARPDFSITFGSAASAATPRATISDEIRSRLMLHHSSVVRDLGLAEKSVAALAKLAAALPESARREAEKTRRRIHVDGAGWRGDTPDGTPDGAPPGLPLLRVIQEAVWAQKKLRIAYLTQSAGTFRERIVEPLGLVAKRGVWYLAAGTDEGVRAFRVSRFLAAEPLSATFAWPEDFDLAGWWERSVAFFRERLPRYVARVRVTAGEWERFRQERFVTVLNREPEQDGWIEADVDFNTPEWACRVLLGCGRHAEALAPEELRRAVREEAEAVAAR